MDRKTNRFQKLHPSKVPNKSSYTLGRATTMALPRRVASADDDDDVKKKKKTPCNDDDDLRETTLPRAHCTGTAS